MVVGVASVVRYTATDGNRTEHNSERDEREPSLPFNVLEAEKDKKALYNMLLCGGSSHSYRHMTTNTPHRHMGWRKF